MSSLEKEQIRGKMLQIYFNLKERKKITIEDKDTHTQNAT